MHGEGEGEKKKVFANNGKLQWRMAWLQAGHLVLNLLDNLLPIPVVIPTVLVGDGLQVNLHEHRSLWPSRGDSSPPRGCNRHSVIVTSILECQAHWANIAIVQGEVNILIQSGQMYVG